ncbi:serine/threonine-protein phosphatase [Clostridium sp. SYSU_GA19001]|uniref:SpoIIE family protein phosphatase n=1 Tax=Clostridium caldaquaticum TaxID=2940653 RepID=UPI002076F6FF|nr:SpoIIE family protein phosphatase [Clostridium caldaquaticum]MCM8712143.1 serine/threonine-protein phosphatase [Clostridium caldaquaticum]
MNFFIDISYNSLNKAGEELCGDKVEVIKTPDEVIIVLADGLGSGVKANILATLTCKIAGTMLKEGLSLYETVDTIVHTLPVCSVRQLAYCTFTIIKINKNGNVHALEYDNPPFFLVKNNILSIPPKKEIIIKDKIIKESNFKLKIDDVLTIVSDGAIHAGVGAILNLGWQWDNVAEYLENLISTEKRASNICKDLIFTCQKLYDGMPGDDTTVVTVALRKPELINIFTGPPMDKKNDSIIIKKLMNSSGKKIVCGGTAANIAARELEETISVNFEYFDPSVPPTAVIKGIDLVTEGVLTLSKAVEKIKTYLSNSIEDKISLNLEGKDGASKLAKILIEDCTHLNLFVGKAINPAHQNPDFPSYLSIKVNIIELLIETMKKLGKEVHVEYF